jgi:hypothetical protein
MTPCEEGSPGDIVQCLGDSHGDMRGADFSMDAPGSATSCASNGVTRSCEEREIDAPPVRWQGNGGQGPFLNPRPSVRGRRIRG